MHATQASLIGRTMMACVLHKSMQGMLKLFADPVLDEAVVQLPFLAIDRLHFRPTSPATPSLGSCGTQGGGLQVCWRGGTGCWWRRRQRGGRRGIGPGGWQLKTTNKDTTTPRTAGLCASKKQTPHSDGFAVAPTTAAANDSLPGQCPPSAQRSLAGFDEGPLVGTPISHLSRPRLPRFFAHHPL